MIPAYTLEQFDRILEVIRREFPGSRPVIGGGALRDSILGKPIKDVDVFLRAKDHNYTLDSGLTKRIRCSPQTLAYGRADMHGAWDFYQHLEGYPVQLILADFENLEDLAHTFDTGLSRVTYDGEQLYVSPEFAQDVADKAFRVRRADNPYELERTLKRIKRHQEKYPDYVLDESTIPCRSRCPTCGDPIIGRFRNEISEREYRISGMCQKCQDSVFGPD